MKRTGEYTLLIIGLIFSIIGIVLSVFFKFAIKTEDFKVQFENEFNNQIQQSGDIPEGVSANEMLNLIQSLTTFSIIVLIISILLAVFAIVFIKRRRVLAAIFSILAGLVSLLAFNILSLLLFIIAGIMLLVRKNKSDNQFEEAAFQNNDNLNHDTHNGYGSDFNNEKTHDVVKDEVKKNKNNDDPYIY
ncbi:DUF4064 domain-containing protein [Mammaliicoccus stepanovicii]|uniref:Membrane protein n=1 Tax=Mammaliicoccus stepanovicii TaxID=643214 RepID=A0A239ZNC3_9STAP|nr:DUF4064 domain-containing protein [Mammaliicoccus stepanovicii]PNZ79195.1 hypothetical protein CD111_00645 [Mammaliicoccus stepanovicii]GGI41461.1 hypothetical protein GCM10010896_13550 [Mammaliicoccus stepanovicii]SNV72527.1 membrane protein [Mammaliicoccus stepanovicii]